MHLRQLPWRHTTVAQDGLEFSQRSTCHHTQLFFSFFLDRPLTAVSVRLHNWQTLEPVRLYPSTTVTDVASMPRFYVGAGNRTQDIRLARQALHPWSTSQFWAWDGNSPVARASPKCPVPCAHSIQPAMCAALCILQIKRLEQSLQHHTHGVMCGSEPTMQAWILLSNMCHTN